MRLLKVSAIKIKPDRQRQEFNPEKLMELTQSIEKTLLHPPVVQPSDVEGEYWLVAGERRMRAIKDMRDLGGTLRYGGETIPDDMIPVTLLGELDELEAEELELEENIQREDLTWQEHVAAMARLKDLRGRQQTRDYEQEMAAALAAQQPIPEPPKPYSTADLAQEVRGSSEGYHQGAVRKELVVAKHLDNPAIAKAKNVDEAYKILKKEEKDKQREILAGVVGSTFSSSAHKALQGNCLTLLDEPEFEGKFDIVLTDPPYGMGAQDFGDGAGRLPVGHNYDDSYESWRKLMKPWAEKVYKACKPNAHLYAFCDIDNFHELKKYLQEAGFYVFRTPLTYIKVNSGRVPLPEYGPRRQTEWVIYAMKGKKEVNQIYPDYFEARATKQVEHAAQKPLDCYTSLLMRSAQPGDEILDTFAGSGVIFEACHQFKCKATGIEQNLANYGMCLETIENLDKEQDLLSELM